MTQAQAFWTCAAVTLVSAAVSCGFAVAGLLGTGRHDPFAMYAASRSVALLLVAAAAAVRRSREAVASLAAVMSVVQLLDVEIGLTLHDPAKTVGPAVLAVATLAAREAMARAKAV